MTADDTIGYPSWGSKLPRRLDLPAGEDGLIESHQ